MNILEALHTEEGKLHRQLSVIKGTIAALNGSARAVVSVGRISNPKSTNGRRIMSAASRAKISRKAKARWAKIKAEQSKGKTAR
jgi:hypothetical protein